MWDTFRSTYPLLPSGLTHFGFVNKLLEGNLHLQHSSSPFLSRVYWFWYTLRYAEVLFSSVLTLRAGEVVSVVDQFSNVSKVNILCSTQVCKCFHYNTSFSSVTYRARLLPESRLQPPSADEPSGCPTPPHTHLLSPSRPGFEGDDNTKVLHTGGWVWILWVTEQWPKQQRHVIQTLLASHPQLPSHFLWYQQTQRWKALGRNKMHLFFHHEAPPKALLGRDVFTPLFIHFDDHGPTITATQRRAWINYLVKATQACK